MLLNEFGRFAEPSATPWRERVHRSTPRHVCPAGDDLTRPLMVKVTAGLESPERCAARHDISPDDVLPGVRIPGAAVFVEECLRPDAQALIY